MDIRDWCTDNFFIFGELTDAINEVSRAQNALVAAAQAVGRLDSPGVVEGFDELDLAAQRCRYVVDRALDLPAVPDTASNVQFRDAMTLRGRCADSVRKGARDRDANELDRAVAFAAEATKQGAAIEIDMRRAWNRAKEA